ncbi:hypothetical protein AB6A40_003388 [Gnathostoma spinigerum]|uniref:Uncharacterized protein n=1 Tax=Gnathostoma spinigerum TaxID=75299 RepID=A0ABD6E9E9_9BILA
MIIISRATVSCASSQTGRWRELRMFSLSFLSWMTQKNPRINPGRSATEASSVSACRHLSQTQDSSSAMPDQSSSSSCIPHYTPPCSVHPIPASHTPQPEPEGVPYKTVRHHSGEYRADDILHKISLRKCHIAPEVYEQLTDYQKNIYNTHLKAVEERKLHYRDPKTGYVVMTVSNLLHLGECCGNGCRHCPYGHRNANDKVKGLTKWNGAFYS